MSEVLLDGIISCIGTVLRRPVSLTATTLAADVAGWDSFATVDIIFAVEERFGFCMDSVDMERIDGVAALLEITTRLLPVSGMA